MNVSSPETTCGLQQSSAEGSAGAVTVPCQAGRLLVLAFWFESRCANSLFLRRSQEVYKDANTQVHTLRKMVKEKEEAIQRQSTLEKKIHELEKQGTIKIQKKGDGDISILPVALASGTVPAASEAVAGTSLAPGAGAAPSVPLPPPPPPLPALAAASETGKEPFGRVLEVVCCAGDSHSSLTLTKPPAAVLSPPVPAPRGS